jgi:probable F420-dependent oxidoreductase
MKFGVCIPNYGEVLSLDLVRSIALEAENLGYDSLWTTDHVLMPQNSSTPYEHVFDSIATLCYLAPLTKKVKLGVSCLIIAMRNPAVVAKQLGSLDHFSQGRVLLAIASGWNEREFSFVGSNYHVRGKRVDESIKILRALWAGDTAFHGKFFDFENVVFEPRPYSKSLEIWIGGASQAAMMRAAELGDAFHPNVIPLQDFSRMISEFRSVSARTRNMGIRVRVALNLKSKESEIVGAQGYKRLILSGDMERNKETIKELEGMGVDYALLVPSPDGKVSEQDQLHSLRGFAEEFL